MNRPALSLILCSRNDKYMGNSIWRLQTTLNYVAQRVAELSREEEVEVLVADWGSDIPLYEVLELTPAAARIVSFIKVPPEIARVLQKDSPFAEVLALNAAARRADGEYIGRIDQDTLVGRRFLEFFFELYESRQQLAVPLTSALLFANQRMVPYRFMVHCPSLWVVEKYIGLFNRLFQIEASARTKYYNHGVGIWLAHKNLWYESGGYDERMIYMNAMEINLIARLMKKHPLVNLGELVNYDFYHIEHYHPLAHRSSSTHRKVNHESLYAKDDILKLNGPDWGLFKYAFEILPYSSPENPVYADTLSHASFKWLFFILLLVSSGLQIAADEFIKPIRIGCVVWNRRAHIAWETVRGHRFVNWPGILAGLWERRKRDYRGKRR